MWTTAMGLRYPADATLASPAHDATVRAGQCRDRPGDRSVSRRAAGRLRAAAAEEAVRRVDAEIAVTRRRMRALEKRWLPWLHGALAALELSLEQAEQEDGMRLRRAVTAQPDRRSLP